SQLSHQIIRSGISSALNYGEAQNAQSKKDFIHKVSIVIKELRETYINLKIIQNTLSSKDENQVIAAIKENDELLAIFTKTLLTAKRNEGNNGR
ncbi:MAG: four helix bundle protein, partial [Bacteroidales bacterium]|nr:four helix bundle protein [Bacteroidales bacterium]